jgi:hypothetical protein
MKTEKKEYKVGQKIGYSFTKIPDYRQVVIEEISATHFKFKDVTGWWSRSETFIQPDDFKPGKMIKTCSFFGDLVY